MAERARVSGDWLALREPADAAARDSTLAAHVRTMLGPNRPWVIHDLGAGTGAMTRWLAPRLNGPQHWVVHDLDPDLLQFAVTPPPEGAADGAEITVEPNLTDITRLRADDLAGASLITASALLDMLTEDELAGLVSVCATAGCPILLTLSVVGHVILTPSEPTDHRVAVAFDAHQRRLTDRGRLLGPDAAGRAVELFEGLSREVVLRHSPWRLGPEQCALAREWFTGWVAAAREHDLELAAGTDEYVERRLAQAAAGRLAVTVDHADLLVLPAPRRSASSR
jgi:hypothetical protein